MGDINNKKIDKEMLGKIINILEGEGYEPIKGVDEGILLYNTVKENQVMVTYTRGDCFNILQIDKKGRIYNTHRKRFDPCDIKDFKRVNKEVKEIVRLWV